jgi:hypothetical protein
LTASPSPPTAVFGSIGDAGLFRGLTIGPLIQADYTFQFDPTPKQATTSNTVTAGAFAQMAFGSPFVPAGFDNFRFRGGEVNGSTGTYFTTFVAEWIPVYGGPLYIGAAIPTGLSHLSLFFSPELMIQYDQLNGGPNTYLLLSTKSQDLRIGPQAVFQVSVPQVYADDPFWSRFAPFSALVSYHASWDSYSGSNYSWTSASVTYTLDVKTLASALLLNVDPKKVTGHFGITGSYGYGNSETTGNKTNQVKLGLSAKF